MGLKGYNYVKEYFSWDVVIDKIKEELAKVLEKTTEGKKGRRVEW